MCACRVLRCLQGKDVYTNVFVKNLPNELGDDELTKMAAEFGEVTSAVVMKVGSWAWVGDTVAVAVGKTSGMGGTVW